MPFAPTTREPRRSDLPAVDDERELIELLRHRREPEKLLPVHLRCVGPGLKRHREVPEPDVLPGGTPQYWLIPPGHPSVSDDAEGCWLSVGDMHGIGEHIEYGEVVLDDNDRPLKRGRGWFAAMLVNVEYGVISSRSRSRRPVRRR